MKPKDFYTMSYELKRMLSRMTDPQHRNDVKKLMIDAEKIAAAANKKRFTGKSPMDDSEF